MIDRVTYQDVRLRNALSPILRDYWEHDALEQGARMAAALAEHPFVEALYWVGERGLVLHLEYGIYMCNAPLEGWCMAPLRLVESLVERLRSPGYDLTTAVEHETRRVTWEATIKRPEVYEPPRPRLECILEGMRYGCE